MKSWKKHWNFFSENTMKAKLEAKKNSCSDEKSFFFMILGFKPYCDYNLINSYTSFEIVSIFTFEGVDLKCDSFEVSFLDGLKKNIIFSFA